LVSLPSRPQPASSKLNAIMMGVYFILFFDLAVRRYSRAPGGLTTLLKHGAPEVLNLEPKRHRAVACSSRVRSLWVYWRPWRNDLSAAP
jgi:hypothetical protein